MRGYPVHRHSAGFTLVELMVVITIIVVLLMVAIPSVQSVLQSTDMAQAENMMRAALMSARSYAIQNSCVAGVRCQPDGYAVIVWGDLRDPDRYDSAPSYRMRAVAGFAPQKLPGPYRAVTLTRGDNSAPVTWREFYRFFPLVMFNDEGRVIFPQAYFYDDWYPRDSTTGQLSGHFGDCLYSDDDASTQPRVYYDTLAANLAYVQRPAVTHALKLVNINEYTETSIERREHTYTPLAAQFASTGGTSAAQIESDALNESGTSIVLDSNTGLLIRTKAYQAVALNDSAQATEAGGTETNALGWQPGP